MRRILFGVLCLCVSLPSWAQVSSPPTPSAPPVVRAEEDTTVEWTDDDRLLFGADRREVTPLGLFEALGRTDLLERGQANARRRFILGISAAVVGVVGLGVGIALLATTPDTTSGRCNTDAIYFNEVCTPTKATHEIGGVAFIAGGLVIAGVLGSIAWWSRPEVFTKWELKQFIKEHNAKVGGPPVTLQLLPAVGPGFEGLVARGTF